MRLPEHIENRLLTIFIAAVLAAGCGISQGQVQPAQAEAAETQISLSKSGLPAPGLPEAFDRSSVPEFSGTVWADVNEDVPFFDEIEMEAARGIVENLSQILQEEETEQEQESQALQEEGTGQEQEPQALQEETADASQACQVYGSLDRAGRCTGAVALVGPETIPQEERGQIGMIKPTGWHTVKYDGIDGNYLYNRCHLIGFQLTGQDANERNLITGTRFLNIEGMLPYEDSVLAYVKGTGNHVLYRVTPVFEKDNLLADGVLMEARSVEDPLVQFCAFCYNVQPGITIDYATGESSGTAEQEGLTGRNGTASQEDGIGDWKYIVNVSSGKFHRSDCESVKKMSKKNMQGYNGTREELIDMGYTPCKNCNP